MVSTAICFLLTRQVHGLNSPTKKLGKVDVPTLEYYQDRFVIRTRRGTSGQVSYVSRDVTEPAPKLAIAFRKNESYAVWDERGLTIRRGTRSRTTRLSDLGVSTRYFSADEVKTTEQDVAEGSRSKEANALSGAVRIGNFAYFLARWDDADKKPWSEVLLRVSMVSRSLHAEPLGKFEGLSLASRSIDDRLFVHGDQLAIVARTTSSWGLSLFDPGSKQFSFHRFGDHLVSFTPAERHIGRFVEQTAYGTSIAGELSLSSGVRTTLYEGRGDLNFLDSANPPIVVATRVDATRLIDTDSGALMRVTKNSGVARSGDLILVWAPSNEPTTASLYSPERWSLVSSWTALPK